MGVLAFGLLPAAHAHHRDFSFSRDWFLPYKGEKEIEARTTYVPDEKAWIQEFEFEYGITDDFAIEPGIEFHKDGDGDKLHLDGYEVELRFRIGTFATNRLLYAFNIGLDHPVRDESPHGEFQALFTYLTEEGTNFCANINVGQSQVGDPESESEFTFGVVTPFGANSREEMGYNVGFRGGIEFMRNLNDGSMRLGPTLVMRRNKNFNMLLSALFPLNNSDENKSIFKFIAEYEF